MLIRIMIIMMIICLLYFQADYNNQHVEQKTQQKRSAGWQRFCFTAKSSFNINLTRSLLNPTASQLYSINAIGQKQPNRMGKGRKILRSRKGRDATF